MKRTIGLVLCFTTMLFPASQITISESGTYILGGSITYNSTSSSDSIILINTSNVVLDLNNLILTQGNPGTPMLAGVAVASSVSNVKIKNGTINNISGSGILSQSGDQAIAIENITTNSCTTGFNIQTSSLVNIKNSSSLFPTSNAVLINGSSFAQLNNIFTYSTRSDAVVFQQAENCSLNDAFISNSGANGISITTKSDLIALDKIVTVSCQTNGINLSQSTNCKISNFNILNCALSGSTALNISQSNFLNIVGCKLLQNGTISSTISAIDIVGCSQSLFKDIVISSSVANLTGVNLTQGTQLIFDNCNVISSFASTNIAGFLVNDILTSSCIFDNCSVLNSISAGTFSGFTIGSSSAPSSMVFKNCSITNNQCNSSFFAFNISAAPCQFYILENCNVKNNTCNSNLAFIFFTSGITKLLINNCSIINNKVTVTGGQGLLGFFISGDVLGSIKNTALFNNSSAGTLTGLDISGSTSCHLTECYVSNCVATGGNATGIQLATATLCNAIRCVSNNNYSSTNSAIGFNFLTTTDCAAQDCQAFSNNGATGSDGFSISGVSNTLIRNSASGNSTNFVGFNANNFVVPTDSPTDTNASCTPWTNFGITS